MVATDAVEEASAATPNAAAVALCCLINVFGGFAMVVLSFVAPAIAAAWQLPLAALRPALGMGFLGMALGGLLVAPRADRVGRRTVILACLAVLGAATAATGVVSGVGPLMVARLVAGIGIGGLLAVLTVAVAEHTTVRWRILGIMTLHAGYPTGGVLAGTAASMLHRDVAWPVLFYAGAMASLALLLAALRWLPKAYKSAAWTHAGAPAREAFPWGMDLLAATWRWQTIAIWTAFVLYSATVYLVIVELPALSVLRGMTGEQAAHVGALVNAGSIPGMVALGLLTRWIALRRLITAYLVSGALLLALFAAVPVYGYAPLVASFLIGALVMAGFIGLYAVASGLYPAHLRATGVGWAVGIGRLGIVAGPLLSAALRLGHWPPAAAIAAVGLPVLCAALVVSWLATSVAGAPPDPPPLAS